jgi:hypothetical protein
VKVRKNVKFCMQALKNCKNVTLHASASGSVMFAFVSEFGGGRGWRVHSLVELCSTKTSWGPLIWELAS